MREILQVSRAERTGDTLRFKEQGTLERHDIPADDIDKIFVRLTPRPDKHIIADFLVRGSHVYRITQEKTVIDYRTFVDEIALSGIENFRKFVTECMQLVDESKRDAASVEFGHGGPPEGFASDEEYAEYSKWLEGKREKPPEARRSPAADDKPDFSHIEDNKQRAEAIWKEFGDDLRAAEQAELRSVDPRLGGLVVSVIGFVISGGGIVSMLWVLGTEKASESAALYGLLGLAIVAGLALLTLGLLVLHRVEQDRKRKEEKKHT